MVFIDFNREDILNALGLNLPIWLMEAMDIIVISLVLGFIFKDMFLPFVRRVGYDPLAQFQKKDRSSYWMAVYSVAPAIVLHEMSHKFVALLFGLKSVFYASYGFFGLG